MRKRILSGLIAAFLVTLAVPTFAQSFSTSDLEGTWIGYDISVNPAIPAVFWLRGTATMDATGKFIEASYTAPDGTIIKATGGRLALDRKGVISGSFTLDTGDTATVVHGKLDQSKTQAAFVSVATDSSMDIGYFFKSGGNFLASDLEGTWYGYQTIIDATTGAVFWVYGTYDVDVSGSVTGSFTGPDGSIVTVDSGTLSLDGDGILSGNLALSNGRSIIIAHGKIDQSKTTGIFVSTEPDGSMSLGQLVKAGGTFKQSDGAGNWYVYGLSIDPSIPAVFWVYGDDARVDASGKFTGSFTAPTGDTIGGTGTASIDSNGVITGNFSFDTGDTGVSSLKLDQGKTINVGVSVTTSGALAIWRYIRASNVALPGMPLLLFYD
jgi:hypothetical protein